ncbi:unnamed protein product [Staurois parvus]|uniref:Uncharacterized protein n=1 Tax=Staurois parvus TaxID=386267 RepID=A0ABN9C4U2_9NEOB|nr:unnamed protein product [Staurois parvus]
MTDYGPGSSMRSRYGGPWQITGLAAACGPGSSHGRLGACQQQWEARNLPAPYDKKWNTPAV